MEGTLSDWLFTYVPVLLLFLQETFNRVSLMLLIEPPFNWFPSGGGKQSLLWFNWRTVSVAMLAGSLSAYLNFLSPFQVRRVLLTRTNINHFVYCLTRSLLFWNLWPVLLLRAAITHFGLFFFQYLLPPLLNTLPPHPFSYKKMIL